MNSMRMFFAVSILAMSGMAVSIPDKIDGRGVAIDFTAEKTLQIASEATIQQVADFAGRVQDEYLLPNITSGNISMRDVYLLYFCLETFDAYMKRLRWAASSEMGIPSSMGGGKPLRCPFPVLRDAKGGEFRIQNSFRDDLDRLAYDPPPDLQSYCAAYNYQSIGRSFNCDWSGKLGRVFGVARDNVNGNSLDSIAPIMLDPECYKGCADDLQKEIEASLGILGDIPIMTACGVGAGAILGAGGVGVAGFFVAVSGPVGWSVAAVGGLAGGGVAAWRAYCYKKDRVIKLFKDSNADIHGFVNRLDTRLPSLPILTKENGPYQSAYMNVVRAQYLLEQWQQSGWKGMGALTAHGQRKLKEWAEATKIRNRDSLTRLEDCFVNYPLVGTILEAQAVCVHLNYLDKKCKGVPSGDEEELRRYWLENSRKVAKLCSEAALYSTLPSVHAQAMCYRNYFEHTYATNRFKTIGEDDLKRLESPLFKSSEEADVKEAALRLPSERGYDELVSAYLRMQKNKALKGVVEALLGDAVLGEWNKVIERTIRDYWMFPRWSAEACRLGTPANSDRILEIVNGSWLHYAIEACLQKSCEASAMESLKTLSGSVWTATCSEDAAKSRLVSFIERKSLPKGVERKIEEKYGSPGKMAADWTEKVLEVRAKGGESGKTSADALSVLAKVVRDEILPLWAEICGARNKWWRMFF